MHLHPDTALCGPPRNGCQGFRVQGQGFSVEPKKIQKPKNTVKHSNKVLSLVYVIIMATLNPKPRFRGLGFRVAVTQAGR